MVVRRECDGMPKEGCLLAYRRCRPSSDRVHDQVAPAARVHLQPHSRLRGKLHTSSNAILRSPISPSPSNRLLDHFSPLPFALPLYEVSALTPRPSPLAPFLRSLNIACLSRRWCERSRRRFATWGMTWSLRRSSRSRQRLCSRSTPSQVQSPRPCLSLSSRRYPFLYHSSAPPVNCLSLPSSLASPRPPLLPSHSLTTRSPFRHHSAFIPSSTSFYPIHPQPSSPIESYPIPSPPLPPIPLLSAPSHAQFDLTCLHLADGRVINVGAERFEAPEALFNPTLVRTETAPLYHRPISLTIQLPPASAPPLPKLHDLYVAGRLRPEGHGRHAFRCHSEIGGRRAARIVQTHRALRRLYYVPR